LQQIPKCFSKFSETLKQWGTDISLCTIIFLIFINKGWEHPRKDVWNEFNSISFQNTEGEIFFLSYLFCFWYA